MPSQRLTITLDGVTAADYLTWVRDPEPPALGRELTAVRLLAEPLGDTIEAVLTWSVEPPEAHAAAIAAGFPLTPEVVSVTSRIDELARRRRRPVRRTRPRAAIAAA